MKAARQSDSLAMSTDLAHGPGGPAAACDAPQPSDIVEYWSGLRGDRRFPAAGDLDAERIVAAWPNSILLSCPPGGKGPRVAALYKPLGASAEAADGATGRGVDFAPMVAEWVLTLAEEARRGARPQAERERFELPGGPVGYAACALPLSDNQSDVDHVLCYVRALR